MKEVVVTAYLPELLAHNAYQDGRGTAGTLGLAIERALKAILARDGVRKKHITKGRITFAVVPPKGGPCTPARSML